jgi:hypothetical protein
LANSAKGSGKGCAGSTGAKLRQKLIADSKSVIEMALEGTTG